MRLGLGCVACKCLMTFMMTLESHLSWAGPPAKKVAWHCGIGASASRRSHSYLGINHLEQALAMPTSASTVQLARWRRDLRQRAFLRFR